MILVTGGTGFIGSHLLLFLARKDKKTRAIYRNKQNIQKTKSLFEMYSAHPDELFQKIEWVMADITDISQLEDVFQGITQVYHTAAMVSFNPRDRQQMHMVNVAGTNNLLTLSLQYKIQKFVHLSSIAALGAYDNPITEETHWNWKENHSEYAVTKYLSEMEVWRATQEGLNAVIINPSVVLGAGFWQENTGKIIAQVDAGMKFYTPGGTGFVDVWDVVKVMHALMESDIATTSFIVSAYNLTYKDLLTTIAKELHKPTPKYALPRIFAELYWRFEKVKSLIFKTPQKLSKSMTKTLYSTHQYSSKNLIEKTNFTFIPFEASIANIISQYNKSKK